MRLSVLVLFASLPLGACASVGTDYSSIAANPTPELINESQRDIDIMRNEMVMAALSPTQVGENTAKPSLLA